jgi:DNA-binding PadR family transcriptional regulator
VSTTRLLVLGVTRIFQPVHGYLVRRELLSWQADDWANVAQGSIYNALRSLTRDGHLAEVAALSPGGRPARTTYQVTPDGEKEFYRLLSAALWEVEDSSRSYLMAGLCFMVHLPRAEVRDALAAREQQVRSRILGSTHALRRTRQQRLTPAWTDELTEAAAAILRGELVWVQDLLSRIDAGSYRFADDPGGLDQPSRQGVWPTARKDVDNPS